MRIRPLIVTGASGVGKTSFSQRISTKLGYDVLNAGELLFDHMRNSRLLIQPGIDPGVIFVNALGESAVGEVIFNRVAGSPSVVVDGVRLYSSFEALKGGNLAPVVVHLTASNEIRIERFVSRSLRDGSASTREAAEAMLQQKDVWNTDLERFETSATWSFDNSGSWNRLDEFVSFVANTFGK